MCNKYHIVDVKPEVLYAYQTSAAGQTAALRSMLCSHNSKQLWLTKLTGQLAWWRGLKTHKTALN
jgi:hypothetical protein